MNTKWFVVLGLACLITSGSARAQGDGKSQASPMGGLQNKSGDAETRPEGVAPITTLESVKVRSSKDDIGFEIRTDRPVTPTPLVLTDPDRLVLDFPNTVAGGPKDRIPIGRDGVSSVRIGVQPGEPPITRVVLDLKQPRTYEIKAAGNSIIVTLHPADSQLGSPQNDPSAPPVASNNSEAAAQGTGQVREPTNDSDSRNTSGTEKVQTAEETVNPTNVGTEPHVAQAENASASQTKASGAGVKNTQDKAPEARAVDSAPATQAEGSKTSDDQTTASAPSPVTPEEITDASLISSQRRKSDKSFIDNALAASPAIDVPSATSDPKGAGDGAEPRPTVQSPPDTAIATLPVKLPMMAAPDIPASVGRVVKREQPIADEYVIGEQDLLSITVWKEKQLSAVVAVREGKITLPLLNDVKVAGLTPRQLRALLIEKLKPFVAEPEVTVAVREIHSRHVLLVGEVGRTGSFSLNSPTTVLQLLAEGGGLKEFAKRKKIYILRHEAGKKIRFPFNYDQVIRGNHMEQNIPLKPGDMIVVP